MDGKIKVAVLVEGHPYDVVGFQNMLWSFEDCDCFVQPLDLFCQDEKNRDWYDVVLYYNMNLKKLDESSRLYKYLTQNLGSTKQGIVLMHHGLLSFPKWDVWTQVSGVKVRCEDGVFSYHQNEHVGTHIEDTEHPITHGVDDFEVIDETYIIGEPQEPGNHALLTTENANSINTIGWARTYKNSRVFCYASGHDHLTYDNASFRRLVHNGLRWCALKC